MKTNDLYKAYKEILILLNVLPKEYQDKIPPEILSKFKLLQDQDYHPSWEEKITINNPELSKQFLEETLAIIAWLNLEYWEEDENRKQELIKTYQVNSNIKHLNELNFTKKRH